MSDQRLLRMAIERFRLRDYLRQYGAQGGGLGEWVMTCPRCMGEEKLVVNVGKTGAPWHCWKCQVKGPPDYRGKRRVLHGGGGLIKLVQWLEGCDRRRAIAFIVSGVWWGNANVGELPREELVAGLLELNVQARPVQPPPHWRNFVDGQHPYLLQRGISFADVQQFGLVWCDDGRYRNRLIFPVWEGGEMVYFQARAMFDGAPGDKGHRKALNPSREESSVTSDEVLMNLDQARHYPRVAVTEGPIDCVHAGASAVCTFGKVISPVQIAKLLRAGVRSLDLMWDPEAVEEMRASAPLLSELFDLRVVQLPAGTDPGDLPREYLDQMRGLAGTYSKLAWLE